MDPQLLPYRNNIWKLYALQICNGFVFAVPIFFTVFNSVGLGAQDLFILQALYAVFVVVFEIPTGFFGDKYGRKISMAIGGIGYILAYITYYFAHGFRGFFVGEIIIAFAASCISGCDKALLYDSLAQLKHEKNYKKISGIVSSLSNFAEASGAIISGIVASHILKLPFLLDALTHLIGFLIILTLKEVPIERLDHKEATWKQIQEIWNYITHGHEYLGRLLVTGAIMSATSLSLVWVTQPYMNIIKLPLVSIGIIRSALNISVGIFHLTAYKYEKILGTKNSFLSLIWIRGLGIIIAGLLGNMWGLLSFVVFAFVRATQRTITEDIMQTAVISKIRATIASVQSMLFRLGFAILGPLLGYFTDHYSLSTALYAFAVITTIISLGCFYTFWNKFSQVQ